MATFTAGQKLAAATLEDLVDAWDTWTPTLTNLTQGNGTVLARYKQLGKTVHYRFRFTLGTTSAVGTSPRFTLPVAPLTSSYVTFVDPLGAAALGDTGTNTRFGQVFIASGSTVEIYGFSTTGTLVVVTATVPHTWATTDTIGVSGIYEAA